MNEVVWVVFVCGVCAVLGFVYLKVAKWILKKVN